MPIVTHLPKSIKIGFKDFNVREEPIKDRHDKLGSISYMPPEITLESTLDIRSRQEVLLHEIQKQESHEYIITL